MRWYSCVWSNPARWCMANHFTYRHKLFKELTAVFDASKACFKGLQEDPDSGTETCYWPCNEDQHDEPDKRKARISTHGCSCCVLFGLLGIEGVGWLWVCTALTIGGEKAACGCVFQKNCELILLIWQWSVDGSMAWCWFLWRMDSLLVSSLWAIEISDRWDFFGREISPQILKLILKSLFKIQTRMT